MDRFEQTWETARERGLDLLRAVDRRLPKQVSDVLHRLARRDVLLTGSSLAFYGLLSALPMLMISFAVIEGVAGEQTLQRFVQQASSSGPEGTQSVIQQLARNGGSLTWLTALFTVWPATAYGGGLRRSLLYAAGEEGHLPGLRGRLIGLGLIFALPAMLLAGIPLMFVLSNLARDGLAGTLLGLGIGLLAGSVLGTGLVTLIYKAFAPSPLGWADTLRGGALTGVVTAVFSLLFVLYLSVGQPQDRFGGGTVAIVVMFGVWLFVANVFLLAGFHTVLELHDDHDGDERAPAQPSLAGQSR